MEDIKTHNIVKDGKARKRENDKAPIRIPTPTESVVVEEPEYSPREAEIQPPLK